MNTYDLLIPLGIASYVFLLLAAISGILLFKFQVMWIKLKWHIWFGVLAVVAASLHAAIIILNR